MINATENCPINVVGGDTGGLAAALSLSRQGFHVQVLEQSLEYSEIGAGILLGLNAFKKFEKLGITEEVTAEVAVFPERLVMEDLITGEEVTELRLYGVFCDRFEEDWDSYGDFASATCGGRHDT